MKQKTKEWFESLWLVKHMSQNLIEYIIRTYKVIVVILAFTSLHIVGVAIDSIFLTLFGAVLLTLFVFAFISDLHYIFVKRQKFYQEFGDKIELIYQELKKKTN